MNISIFGLGYIGCVGLGCLAQDGHQVTGVDVNLRKVQLLKEGRAPLCERGLDELIGEHYRAGKIKATADHRQAVLETELSLICVGTPSTPTGLLNLENVFKVAREIGRALKDKKGFHVVAVRSTVLPGTCTKVGRIMEEESGKRLNHDFAIVANPEFLREGSAIEDYYHPPYVVIGTDSHEGKETMKNLYNNVQGELVIVDLEVAELIKFVSNSFHALKVVFANEIATICKKMNIDAQQLMTLFCLDRKQNISPSYFQPGFPYGGSCLAKDLRALKTLAQQFSLHSPILDHIEQSNGLQKEYLFQTIVQQNKKKIGLLGLSFKEGTDDLRNSLAVELAARLIANGFDLLIYDPHVELPALLGANKEELIRKLPSLNEIFTKDLQHLLDYAEILVSTYPSATFTALKEKYPEKIFLETFPLSRNSSEQKFQEIL